MHGFWVVPSKVGPACYADTKVGCEGKKNHSTTLAGISYNGRKVVCLPPFTSQLMETDSHPEPQHKRFGEMWYFLSFTCFIFIYLLIYLVVFPF